MDRSRTGHYIKESNLGHPAHVALTKGVVKAVFVTKLRIAATLAAVAIVLAAGTGRYLAVAGQSAEQRGKQPSPSKQELPKADKPREEAKIPRVPFTKRTFRIDLLLTREKNGQRKVLACPRKIAPEGSEACFRMEPQYGYTFGRSRSEVFGMGPSVHVKVYSAEGGKVCLLMTVNQPILGTFAQDASVESRSMRILRKIELGRIITAKLRYGDKNQSVLEVAAAVHDAEKGEKDSDANATEAGGHAGGNGYSRQQSAANSSAKKKLDASTIAAADKDLKIAEFYRRNGPLASARFYYDLICSRYPGRIHTEHAKNRLAELKQLEGKPLVRIGQLFLIGNEKTSDNAILELVPFFPGEFLYYSDIRLAEQNLSRLKGLKSKPKVTVIEGDGEYKDIQITVEEK